MMWLLAVPVFLALAVWLYFYFSPARRSNFNHRVTLEDAHPIEAGQDADAGLPQAAILCPGRNEASWIDKTIPDLCEQDYPNLRVIYIDDHSDDATPAITSEMDRRYAHLTVVRNEVEPPAGWVGKCWAVRQGYAALQASEKQEEVTWVCFTDADIRWHPQCLRAAMRYGQRLDADVVGLFPKMEFGTAVEPLGQLTMVLALGLLFPFDKAMDPRCPDTLTGGAFILVRRSLYDQIGGHESVKGCVVEDLNLGKNLKAAGARIRIAVAPELMRCRMYEGWADMWEGLTKNAYAGMQYKPHWAVGFLSAAWLINVLPPVYLAVSLVWALRTHEPLAWAMVAASVLTQVLQCRAMNAIRKMFGLRWWWALSVSPGSALYSLFMVASIWRYYMGGNKWKGRTYSAATLQQ